MGYDLCGPRVISDHAPQRQEMVLLHTGNELMGQIRRENASGIQNKSRHKQRAGVARPCQTASCSTSTLTATQLNTKWPPQQDPSVLSIISIIMPIVTEFIYVVVNTCAFNVGLSHYCPLIT